MNTFPIFSRAHTDTYNDSFIGSLLVHSPWETHHQPATTKCPPRYWLFDQPPPPTTDNVVLHEYTSSQFGFMVEEYHHHQSPGILPINSSELQPYDKEYSGPTSSCTKKALHNARERHRRKTLKVLYSQLSSLLPNLNPKVNLKPTSFSYRSIVLMLMAKKMELIAMVTVDTIVWRRAEISHILGEELKYLIFWSTFYLASKYEHFT